MSVYIALGSNLEDSISHVSDAVNEIGALPGCQLLKQSSWYQTKAIGPGNQPDYINGVILITTTLSPIALLDALQGIENQHGRVRTLRWGARTLDLDILFYEDQQIDCPRLNIPHPRIAERAFVVAPLLDLVKRMPTPPYQPLADLLSNLDSQELQRLKI
ncbi:2-amino-4-hydroxy-6-hydroxymethyldihydropteridinepyrophosphokinase [Sinobacterium norvegicum]|uniref:2-amino-4-hydroxy-6-hydroxymethyldihydropteridine pyrophosphokinase n=1 Tax=Sinobacterium norvegicum TaxID=1641715 RepID=A0ABN8EIN9_9GAMM|nr:2-amino-4-hydroxy-6-hydroxymethyldihydropteridine diphosphokinase [Sinobacterium norvegicum]CAH0992249.1 2-amino-4-hydroxy-6-hydroxymethyldihydropteridinepyrophosphokinase [Sinobacterium norvegicum]